jgi:riboflavin synthase
VPETLARTNLGALTRDRASTRTCRHAEHRARRHLCRRTSTRQRCSSRGARGRGARSIPRRRARVVLKGFITLDGVSLTIARVGKTFFEIAVIPHTAERTTLGWLRVGDPVNVEVDVIAKYVERIVRAR